MLLCLATFEEDLRKKLQPLATPPALPEIQPPSTNAELITDFRQERYRAARDKLKIQEEKAPQTRLAPSGDRATGRRQQHWVLDKDPEALDPATVRSVQQGSPIIFKEQLQSTAPQKVKDTAGYHRADLHRSGIEAQRRSELPTNSVGYLFTPRQTGAQTGSSWGVPMQEEETDRHTHFVESKICKSTYSWTLLDILPTVDLHISLGEKTRSFGIKAHSTQTPVGEGRTKHSRHEDMAKPMQITT